MRKLLRVTKYTCVMANQFFHKIRIEQGFESFSFKKTKSKAQTIVNVYKNQTEIFNFFYI